MCNDFCFDHVILDSAEWSFQECIHWNQTVEVSYRRVVAAVAQREYLAVVSVAVFKQYLVLLQGHIVQERFVPLDFDVHIGDAHGRHGWSLGRLGCQYFSSI